MNSKIVEWVDPISNELLKQKNDLLISTNSKYVMRDGIPNFVNEVDNIEQKQVQDSFGEKWTKSDFGHNQKEFEDKIKPIYLEMMGLAEDDLDIFKNKIILEVGIGSGSSSKLWAPQSKEFHGADISKAVYEVKRDDGKKVFSIKTEKCIKCGKCYEACKFSAVSL